MKVSELITELQKLNQDLEVKLYSDGEDLYKDVGDATQEKGYLAEDGCMYTTKQDGDEELDIAVVNVYTPS